MWEDGALTVVSIFGKFEDGATTASDAVIAAYDSFVQRLREELFSGAGIALDEHGIRRRRELRENGIKPAHFRTAADDAASTD